MKWEYVGTGLALIGIGVTLMVALPPPWWLKMPPALVHVGVVIGAVLTIIGIILAIFGAWSAFPPPKAAFLGMGFGAIILVISAAWFFLFPEVISSLQAVDAPSIAPSPDVTLRLVYPTNPALLLVNDSDGLAREIKWTAALWNIDLPGTPTPLPIPVQTFDWIRPHNQGGPQDLFNSPVVSPLIKVGNRIIGSISVACPECIRGHTYIVYIEWGKSGWFADHLEEASGRVFIPATGLPADVAAFAAAIQATPEAQRIPITAP